MSTELTSNQIQCIAKAIHGRREDGSPHVGVKINNTPIHVRITPRTGCRYIRYNGLKFVEQNKNEQVISPLACLARAGASVIHAIAIGRRGPWGTIINGVVVKPIPEG